MEKSEVPRWHFISITISTIIIAFAAILSTYQSCTMSKQIKTQIAQTDTSIALQSMFFKKINRPFIMVDDENTTSEVTEGDIFLKFIYTIKNIGTQPAKIKYVTSGLSISPDTSFSFNKEYSQFVSSVIFPNQSENKIGKKINKRDFKNDIYLSYYIEYEDFSGNSYYYKSIARYAPFNTYNKSDGVLIFLDAD